MVAQLAAEVNRALLAGHRHPTRTALGRAYSHARRSARKGDTDRAEALAAFLRVYLPALRAHQASGSDWTSMTRLAEETRLFRAVMALCRADEGCGSVGG